MTLSDKIFDEHTEEPDLHVKDVKEFIKRIKARIILPRYKKIIDEEAGKELI